MYDQLSVADLFRGAKLEKVCLRGLDHVIAATLVDSEIKLRVYAVALRLEVGSAPRAELLPMGPFMDLTVRRQSLASDDLWNQACKRPKK